MFRLASRTYFVDACLQVDPELIPVIIGLLELNEELLDFILSPKCELAAAYRTRLILGFLPYYLLAVLVHMMHGRDVCRMHH